MNPLKKVAGLFLIPLAKWYLRKERTFRYESIVVKVFPGVFHPGMFSSTLFLLGYLQEKTLDKKRVLELGCGTALIAIYCSTRNAYATATDINSLAVKNALANAELNKASISVIQSDLFDQLKEQKFDFIVINPPYYAAEVKTPAELAWNCGRNFEYFHKLFSQIGSHIHDTSEIIMVLTKGCNVYMISSIATAHGFRFDLVREKEVLFDERDYIFRIISSSASFQA
jgi:release factor glutamine methyltransferase